MIEFLRGWDHELSLLVNKWAVSHEWVRYCTIFCADYLIFILGFLTVFFLLYVCRSKESRVEALRGFLASLAATYAVKLLIGKLFFRARPFAVLVGVKALIVEPLMSHSFPSGHATIAGALATTIYWYDKKWGKRAWILAFLVAFGRVATGVHYPIDVIAGLLLGSIGTYILMKFNRI